MAAQDELKQVEDSSLKNKTRETLLAWRSGSRPFKKRSKEYWATLGIIVFLVIVILYFFSQYVLILAVITLTFLAIVLSTVAPSEVDYKITSQGIVVGEHAYLWSELYDFYFKKEFGQDVVIVRSQTFLPTLITITLDSITKEQVKETLVKHIPYREVVPKTFMDKAGDWLARTFPLEKN